MKLTQQRSPGSPSDVVVAHEGMVTGGEISQDEGDYMFICLAKAHDVVAVTGAVIIVSSWKSTPVLGS